LICYKKALFNLKNKGIFMSETLVVVSKVKAFIKSSADMNTSASAVDALSRIVEKECLKAIEKAKNDKRKTVMDRDFTCDECSCG
jgi:hypothetical protein